MKEKGEEEPKEVDDSEAAKDPSKFKEKRERELKRLVEFEKLIAEAPLDKFDVSGEEKVLSDPKLIELSKFLKETSIPKLVSSFSQLEGVPCDSETLEGAFHQFGVNIRYLGYVNTLLGPELQHIKHLIERDVLLRSFKHIVNEKLRETSEMHISALLSHMLNMLLSENCPVPNIPR